MFDPEILPKIQREFIVRGRPWLLCFYRLRIVVTKCILDGVFVLTAVVDPFLIQYSASLSSSEAIAEDVLRVATTDTGELNVASMKKYIQYCKAKCAPRLSEEAGEVLVSSYVKIRDDIRRKAISARGQNGGKDDTQAVIPITVRQLEALVRISESLARMRIDNTVRAEDVTEALRLFKVSTMAASAADQGQGNTYAAASAPNREEMERTEAFMRSRLTVGSLVNRQRLIEEAAGQGYNAVLVARALWVMSSRGELLERNQGRLLKRIK